MANDSTTPEQVSSGQDTTPSDDAIFTVSSGEDAFFGPEQLAQANGGAPVVVPVPQNENVIRVQVSPGEILELASPFDAGAALLAREADGNLAIKVGDVTVILLGFVAANEAAPVVVETSDGQPIDIATLLASTDPNIDIQTAAGPGQGAQGGQGADNTGAILAQLEGGNGLGGFNAVGKQDGTELRYGGIDNSILQARFTETSLLGTTPFKGLSEPFLRDPAHIGAFVDFDKFILKYEKYVNHHPGDAWADFTGTAASGDDFASYLQQTSFSSEVGHSSTTPDSVKIDKSALLAFLHDPTNPITSDGSQLKVVMRDNDTTAFIIRKSDHALVMVLHIHAEGDPDATSGTGNFVIDTYLINRLDHPDQGQDILTLDLPYIIQGPESPDNPEGTYTFGSTTVDVLDDVPVAHDVTYTSYYGNDDFAPTDVTLTSVKFVKGGHESFTSTDKGYVDEDWLRQGNRDHDNDPSGANSDSAHGDDVGRAVVCGNLDIDFGADGPAGADGKECTFTLSRDPLQIALAIDTATLVNEEDKVVDANGNVLKSDGHELVILSDCVDGCGVEHLVVGYYPKSDSSLIVPTDFGGCAVKVFELTLDVNPDSDSFQDFQFHLLNGIDQPAGGTPESNTQLHFQVVGHDDDGDAVTTGINIQVNDDVPTINYLSGEGVDLNLSCGALFAAIGSLLGKDVDVSKYGLVASHDKGYVDEDFIGLLSSGFALTSGNQDQDNTPPFSGSDSKNGDDVGLNLVVGRIDFGGDGPSDTAQAQLEVLTAGATYVDQAGHTFTSGDPDKPLVVLFSNENFLVVGTEPDDVEPGARTAAPDTLDGLPEIDGNVVFVVAMDNDPSHALTYGGFVFYLNGPIDHSDANEQSLVVQVAIEGAEDADGDSIDSINIQVNDDKPAVLATYYNELPPCSDGEGGYDTNTNSKLGRVDEDWLTKPADFPGNADQDGANQHGDKNGSAHVSGDLVVSFGGDGPADGTQDTTVSLVYDKGALLDADGNPVTSHGHEVLILDSSTATEIKLGYEGGEDSVPVGELIFNPATNHFDFYLYQPLDHTPPKPGKESDIVLNFDLASPAKDADGDTATGVISIHVNDDKPYFLDTQYTSYENLSGGGVDSSTSTNFAKVDEDWLDPNGNQDADANPGDRCGTTHAEGRVTPSYGADGPAAIDAFGFSANEGQKVKVGGDPVRTDDGNIVFLHYAENPADGHVTLIGFSNGANDGVYTDASTQVFTIDLVVDSSDPDFGKFTFDLEQPLRHPDGSTEDNLLLGFGVQATDFDGNVEKTQIEIQVNDDAPGAATVAYTSYSGPGEPDETRFDSTAQGAGLLDEAWAAYTGGNGYADTATGDIAAYQVAQANVTVNFGADGAAATPYAFKDYTAGDQFVDANGNSFTAGGKDLVVQSASATQLTVGVEGGLPTFEVYLSDSGVVNFVLDGPLDQSPYGDDAETDLLIALDVIASDTDGDTSATKVNFKVNDDVPQAVDDSPATKVYSGNVLANDLAGADGAKVTGINIGSEIAVTVSGALVNDGNGNLLEIHQDGSWNYYANVNEKTGSIIDVYSYTITDGDGDTSTANLTVSAVGPTHNTANLNGTTIEDDVAGGHTLQGADGNDLIYGYDGGDTLKGKGGDDILVGGDGKDTLHGNGGDDTLFGGNNDDDLYGDNGHDAMAGGKGDDVIHNVDAKDLDGTNTLDGIHSIDGGAGNDTVQLGGLGEFGLLQAARVENVEVLDFKQNDDGDNPGTTVTLNYDAVYGITQIGGLHVLTIHGDNTGDPGADDITLQDTAEHAWTFAGNDGTFATYTSGTGGQQVTVHIDQNVQHQVA